MTADFALTGDGKKSRRRNRRGDELLRVSEMRAGRKGLRVHPIADCFGDHIPEADYYNLMKSLAADGLRRPLVIFEGMILDGRKRLCALEDLGKEIRCVPYNGKRPFWFVVEENKYLTCLNEGQRAIGLVRYWELYPPPKEKEMEPPSKQEALELESAQPAQKEKAGDPA